MLCFLALLTPAVAQISGGQKQVGLSSAPAVAATEADWVSAFGGTTRHLGPWRVAGHGIGCAGVLGSHTTAPAPSADASTIRAQVELCGSWLTNVGDCPNTNEWHMAVAWDKCECIDASVYDGSGCDSNAASVVLRWDEIEPPSPTSVDQKSDGLDQLPVIALSSVPTQSEIEAQFPIDRVYGSYRVLDVNKFDCAGSRSTVSITTPNSGSFADAAQSCVVALFDEVPCFHAPGERNWYLTIYVDSSPGTTLSMHYADGVHDSCSTDAVGAGVVLGTFGAVTASPSAPPALPPPPFPPAGNFFSVTTAGTRAAARGLRHRGLAPGAAAHTNTDTHRGVDDRAGRRQSCLH